jgi:hypothetical protein
MIINISDAVHQGRYYENDDGTFTAFAIVKIDSKENFVNFKESSRSFKVYEIRVKINTIDPNVQNESIIDTSEGRLRVFDIEISGECKLEPLDNQRIGTPCPGENWVFSNIYNLPNLSLNITLSRA